MTGLGDELNRYLTIRRALGFKLARAELLLADFCRYLDTTGADTITTEAALAWACLPPEASVSLWGRWPGPGQQDHPHTQRRHR